MAIRKELTREQIFAAIESGEFNTDIAGSNTRVAVIMSQDWCPFWKKMKEWLDSLEDFRDLDIYELIYNKTDFFDAFLDLKENHWKNNTIPYVRFYIDGKFTGDANIISRKDFLKTLGISG